MNYIAKVIDGKITIFATTGEENEGSPVFVFNTEEEFDAAFEAGEIPDGAIVVKTYDGVEMAGGPFDAELDPESQNAVQNAVLTSVINRQNELIEEVKQMRATLDAFGLSKICPTSVVDTTEDNGLVLGAKEKNASVSGTLAHDIKQTAEKLKWKSLVSATTVSAGSVINIPENDCKIYFVQFNTRVATFSDFVSFQNGFWGYLNFHIWDSEGYQARASCSVQANVITIRNIFPSDGWKDLEFRIAVYGIC